MSGPFSKMDKWTPGKARLVVSSLCHGQGVAHRFGNAGQVAGRDGGPASTPTHHTARSSRCGWLPKTWSHSNQRRAEVHLRRTAPCGGMPAVHVGRAEEPVPATEAPVGIGMLEDHDDGTEEDTIGQCVGNKPKPPRWGSSWWSRCVGSRACIGKFLGWRPYGACKRKDGASGGKWQLARPRKCLPPFVAGCVYPLETVRGIPRSLGWTCSNPSCKQDLPAHAMRATPDCARMTR